MATGFFRWNNVEGASFWLDTSNNEIHSSASTSSGDGGVQELAVAGDGTMVTINGYIADPLLNVEPEPAYIDWETWFPATVIGQKLNQDGSILF